MIDKMNIATKASRQDMRPMWSHYLGPGTVIRYPRMTVHEGRLFLETVTCPVNSN